ncbi:MAG: hypothetical protein ACYCS1_00805 [Gammaproteobacteria bacterium]
MVFSYYHRLTAKQRRIYEASDRVEAIPLGSAVEFAAEVGRLQSALESEVRISVERATQALADQLTRRFGVRTVRVRVLERRPSSRYGELHGLYEVENARSQPVVTLWMRTVQRRQVVAFKTFLRTLLHELVHHLDYEWLKLEDSLHTEGFYKRESSLLHQLLDSATDSASVSRD